MPDAVLKVIPAVTDDQPTSLFERQAAFWGGMIERFGFATVLSCALLFGIWQTVVWTADHVAEPIVNAHIQFLNNTSDTLKSTSESIQSLNAGQTKNNHHLERMIEEQARLTKAFQEASTGSK